MANGELKALVTGHGNVLAEQPKLRFPRLTRNMAPAITMVVENRSKAGKDNNRIAAIVSSIKDPIWYQPNTLILLHQEDSINRIAKATPPSRRFQELFPKPSQMPKRISWLERIAIHTI